MSTVLIDTNSLLVLIVGMVDTRLFKTHTKTSIYDTESFNKINQFIGNDRLATIPHVWAETDNHLHHFSGNYKYPYIQTVKAMTQKVLEITISSSVAPEKPEFFDLGISDVLLLEVARRDDIRAVITSDRKLGENMDAWGISVYDPAEEANQRIWNR